MKKIGIICAGDTELAAFFPYLKEDEVIEKAMLSFHCGQIHTVHVVLLYSGVCKVNAAIAAQLLINRFAVDCILNAGTAGGIQGNMQNRCELCKADSMGMVGSEKKHAL